MSKPFSEYQNGTLYKDGAGHTCVKVAGADGGLYALVVEAAERAAGMPWYLYLISEDDDGEVAEVVGEPP